MSAINEFKITQIVDNGQIIQLTLIENVSTEPISQKQMIIENVSKKLDSETKEQVMPLSTICVILNSFIADTDFLYYLYDLSLTN